MEEIKDEHVLTDHELQLTKRYSISSNPEIPSLRQCKFSCVENLPCGCLPKYYQIPAYDKKFFAILIMGKPGDQEVFQLYLQIMKIYNSNNLLPHYYYQEPVYNELHALKNLDKNLNKQQIMLFDESKQIEFNHLITIGGDGTILFALKYFQDKKILVPPIIAIEKGTLGFMPMFKVSTLEMDINKIISRWKSDGKIKVEEKMRLDGGLYKKQQNIMQQSQALSEYQALNEFVIDRGNFSSLLKVDIYCNEIFLTQFQGDGLIISTPTGSTAYNLSAGGPIMQNELRSITMTPICPFSLSFRPICMASCTKLTIKLSEDSRGNGQISGDGQYKAVLDRDTQFCIEESISNIILIREGIDNNYFQDWTIKLKQLLNWNNTSIEKQK